MPSSAPALPRPVAGTQTEVAYDLRALRPRRDWAVVLHNDEVHGMDEVVLQLMKALGCSMPRAHELMLKVHQEGKATVAIAQREKAERIAGVLGEIQLAVTLRQVN